MVTVAQRLKTIILSLIGTKMFVILLMRLKHTLLVIPVPIKKSLALKMNILTGKHFSMIAKMEIL
jgi:hypothetical protein